MRKESLARGATVLALAGMLVRISGFLYRVPLARWIGSGGLGIYQMAQPAYYAMLALAVGGIPTALSTLVAEYDTRGRPHVGEQVLRLCLAWVTAFGTIAALVLLLGAGYLARMLGNPRTEIALMALAPAVLFFALSACYRGYLQGRQLMSPSAFGNVLEQVGRICGSLAAAALLLPVGLEWAAAGAAFGASVGAVVSLLYLVSVYRRCRHVGAPRWDPGESTWRLAWQVFRLAWPLSVGALVLPALNFLDVAAIQHGLQAGGMNRDGATALYGQFSGMVYPLVTLPAVLSGALASALQPVVTAAWARGDVATVRRRCLLVLRATAMIGLPAAVGLMVMARPILTAIFREPAAASILMWAAPIAVLNPIAAILAGALQGLGHTGLPVRTFTLAMVVKVALDAVLSRMPGVGIHGVAAASLVTYGVACVVGALDLQRLLGMSLPWGRILPGPILAASGMAAGLTAMVVFGWTWRGPWGALGTAALIGPLLYATLLGMAGSLTRADLRHVATVTSPRLERWLHLWPF